MPELPEVETLKRYLEKHILGQKLTKFVPKRNRLRYELHPYISQDIIGAVIKNIERVAKFLVINLDNNNSIIVHLGMSGRFTIQNEDYELRKHDHVIIFLDNNKQLIFNDTRRFGMIYTCKTNELHLQKYLKHFGPEPLSSQFDSNYLMNILKNKKSPIKNALMDNKIVVGVGNIYASESLYLSRISPLRQSNSLSWQEIEFLIKSIKEVLNLSIEAGGTTLRDFVSGDSKPGYFKQKLNIYDRDNELCYNCRGIILKIKQAGRSSFYCPNCQK